MFISRTEGLLSVVHYFYATVRTNSAIC